MDAVLRDGIEVWRGGVGAWECDEMGHMNTRFYVARAMEGLAWLAAELGLPRVFAPDAAATLVLREQHIRFLREARAGAPLHMSAGLVEIGESEATVLQVLRHSATGEIAATFRTRVAHVGAETPAPWPPHVRDRAVALTIDMLPEALPRSIDASEAPPTASRERADALTLATIARGTIGAHLVDARGRMRPEIFIGCVSDGIRQLTAPLREIVVSAHETRPARVGGAVLEFRILYLAWPKTGDRYEVRSGFRGPEKNAFRLIHWMLDPASGRPWGVMEAIGVTFDLDARKIVPITTEARERLLQSAVSGLSL